MGKDKIKMDDALWKIERNISMLEYVFDSIVEGSGIQNQDIFEGAVYEILLGLREGTKMAREVNESLKIPC